MTSGHNRSTAAACRGTFRGLNFVFYNLEVLRWNWKSSSHFENVFFIFCFNFLCVVLRYAPPGMPMSCTYLVNNSAVKFKFLKILKEGNFVFSFFSVSIIIAKKLIYFNLNYSRGQTASEWQFEISPPQFVTNWGGGLNFWP